MAKAEKVDDKVVLTLSTEEAQAFQIGVVNDGINSFIQYVEKEEKENPYRFDGSEKGILRLSLEVQNQDVPELVKISAALHSAGIWYTDEGGEVYFWREPDGDIENREGYLHSGQDWSPLFYSPQAAKEWVEQMYPAKDLELFMHLGRGVMGPIARWHPKLSARMVGEGFEPIGEWRPEGW